MLTLYLSLRLTVLCLELRTRFLLLISVTSVHSCTSFKCQEPFIWRYSLITDHAWRYWQCYEDNSQFSPSVETVWLNTRVLQHSQGRGASGAWGLPTATRLVSLIGVFLFVFSVKQSVTTVMNERMRTYNVHNYFLLIEQRNIHVHSTGVGKKEE